MYISFNWLKTYIPALDTIDIKALADKISGSLAEVEEIQIKGAGLKGIIVGEILETQEHPTSKKLMLARVGTGPKESLQILFAAENKEFVQRGDFFPICIPGGAVYNPAISFGTTETIEIEEKDIDGIKSQGMLCSPRELGVFDEKKGISLIGKENPPGTDITNYFQDSIFEIENKSLTHRPDCFSHRGIAREIVAMTGLDFLPKPEAQLPILSGKKPFKTKLQETTLCRRFTAVTMEGVEVGPSPVWMQTRLAYTGNRPINNIVDISNYIMLDIGYPVHMYDYDKIEKGELTVRKADNKEAFNALNEGKYTLTKDMVVVASKEGVEDLAGIMGGANSEISQNTKNIIIESASWSMFNIRKTSMTLGLTSEASNRFSKGLDSFGTLETVKRVATFIEEISSGEVASALEDIQTEQTEEKTIQIDLKQIKRLLGVEIGKNQIFSILSSLNINLIDGQDRNTIRDLDTTVTFTVPYYRRDLNIPEDLIEEVARIYGYENFNETYPQRTIQRATLNPDMIMGRKIRKHLSQAGLYDLRNYSFVDGTLYEKCNLKIQDLLKLKNPLSPELAYVRNEILPSVIEKISLNLKNFDSFGLFELGKVVLKDKSDDEGIPSQPYKLAGLLTSKKTETFENLKATIGHLLAKLHIQYRIIRLNTKKSDENVLQMFHPNKTAAIYVEDDIIGYFGDMHPLVKKNLKLGKISTTLFSIDYTLLKKLTEKAVDTYTHFRHTPVTTRDFSIWLEKQTEIGEIINHISNKEITHLLKIEAIDLYTEGEKRSLTLRATIGDNKKTLKEEEITTTYQTILKEITEKLKLSLR